MGEKNISSRNDYWLVSKYTYSYQSLIPPPPLKFELNSLPLSKFQVCAAGDSLVGFLLPFSPVLLISFEFSSLSWFLSPSAPQSQLKLSNVFYWTYWQWSIKQRCILIELIQKYNLSVYLSKSKTFYLVKISSNLGKITLLNWGKRLIDW